MPDPVWPHSTRPQPDLFSSEVRIFQAGIVLDLGNRGKVAPPVPNVVTEDRESAADPFSEFPTGSP